MKKNYLAPKSETLMAILKEVCGGNPTGNPSGDEAAAALLGSGAFGQAPRAGAPAAGHSL